MKRIITFGVEANFKVFLMEKIYLLVNAMLIFMLEYFWRIYIAEKNEQNTVLHQNTCFWALMVLLQGYNVNFWRMGRKAVHYIWSF